MNFIYRYSNVYIHESVSFGRFIIGLDDNELNYCYLIMHMIYSKTCEKEKISIKISLLI